MSLRKYTLYGFFFCLTLLFSQSGVLPRQLDKIIDGSGLSKNEVKNILNENKELINDISTDFNDPESSNDEDNQVNDNTKSKQKISELGKLDNSVNDNNLSDLKEDDIEELDIVNDDEDKNDKNDDFDDSLVDIDPVQSSSVTNYFGYDVFRSDPGTFQMSNSISVDPNYIIGPGDEIILMLWGETEINTSYTISSEGYLFIKNIGQIFVNGLTMEKLEKKLLKLLSKVYSSLGSPSSTGAKTFFDISLGGLSNRPLRIFVLGEVRQPGAYSVNTSTTLFSSLFYFNGPTTNGSLREIRLVRNGKVIKKIDFYDYILKGKKVNDIKLQRDDIIFIPSRGKTVSIEGEVNRSAIFELKNSEELVDLLKMAGGLKITAYTKRSQIDRIIKPSERINLNIDRTIVDFNLNELILLEGKKPKFELYDGDKIKIFKISDSRNNVITLTGSVFRPGNYQFIDGIRINELIEKADGVTGDAFLQKVDIFRTNKNNIISKVVVDLEKGLGGDLEHNVILRPMDNIVVYNFSQMLEESSVIIEGHVLNPGLKPFYDDMTLDDLIFSGGGFKNKRHLKNTYFERADLFRTNDTTFVNELVSFNLDSLLINKLKFDIDLKPGDRVVIYSKDDILGSPVKSVSISGAVKRPGTYELTSNLTLNELFFISSGFDDPEFYKTILKERFDIIRKSKFEQKKIFSYSITDVLRKEIQIVLKDEDEIVIYSKEKFQIKKEITIEGDVNLPGNYVLRKNMTLGDIILTAGGVSINTPGFRAEISRINDLGKDENIFTKLFTFDLINDKKFFENRDDNKNNLNFLLKPSDIIIIRNNPISYKQEKVAIRGFVNFPGEYIISKPGELVTDIIQRAGGLRSEAYAMASSLTRNGVLIKLSFEKLIKNPRSKFNFNVLPGDIIEINTRPNLVVVRGSVNNPGNYQYFKGQRFSDYIKMAGGMTKNASRFSSYVTYPNGNTKRLSYFTPTAKIFDGSVINIGRKEDVEPFNLTEYATSITAIYSEFIQLYLLLTLSNNAAKTSETN